MQGAPRRGVPCRDWKRRSNGARVIRKLVGVLGCGEEEGKKGESLVVGADEDEDTEGGPIWCRLPVSKG